MTRTRWVGLVAGLAIVGATPSAWQQTFVLQPQTHICIIGNTLGERLQRDGWLEAMIQARFPKHELVFRNLAFSGDEVDTRLRSKNFGTPDEWLSGLATPIGGYEDNRLAGTNTRADVVFAFFGYNESYAGQAGLDAFKKTLGGWLTHTLGQKYNGKSAPRVVLFSPIAHEDLGSPDLPDGKANNQRLEIYTKAMAEVAKAHAGVVFVDLFTPSLNLYADNKAPLTMQGVHLNSEGNRQIATVIDRTLFGETPKHAEPLLARLRQAVVDKDFYWYQRYRVTDGYSTYGDRAFLTFVRNTPRNVNEKQAAGTAKEDILPSNYEVLQRELPMLDIMTANRDRRIWAVARGGDLKVDDANTPEPIDAKTNLPKASPFLGEAESLSAMTVQKGLKVNLFASEKEFPELVKPVQMSFDTKGRLWVAAWKNYPHWQPKTPMDDKLLILEDTNGDGKADKCTTFAGDLQNPTGFEFYNGGVLVAQQPNLVFLKDTNGDDKYDTKEYSSTDSTRRTRTTRSTASRSIRAARSTCRKGSSTARRSKRRGDRPHGRSTAASIASSRGRGSSRPTCPSISRIRTGTSSITGDATSSSTRPAVSRTTGRRSRRRSTTRRWRRSRRRSLATCARAPSAARRFSRAGTSLTTCRAT